MNTRDLLIEKMLTRASSLTDGEIDEIIADDELRELYDAALHARAAVALKDYDSEREWQAFAASVRRPRHRWMRWAAAAVALAIAGAALWQFALHGTEPSASSLMAGPETEGDSITIIAPEYAAAEMPEPEAPADAAPVLPEKPKIKTHRKPATQAAFDTDVEEIKAQITLNRARIDNEIATIVAQAYIEQSYAEYMYHTGGRGDNFTLSDELISLTAQ